MARPLMDVCTISLAARRRTDIELRIVDLYESEVVLRPKLVRRLDEHWSQSGIDSGSAGTARVEVDKRDS